MKLIKLGGREEYLSLNLIEKVGLVEHDGVWESYVVIDRQNEILYSGTKEIAEKIHTIVLSHVCDGAILDVQKLITAYEKQNMVEQELVDAIDRQIENEKEWADVYINQSHTRFMAVRVVNNPHFDRVLFEVQTSMPVSDGEGGYKPSKWFKTGIKGKGTYTKRFTTRAEGEYFLAKEAKKKGWLPVRVKNTTETDNSSESENTDKP